MRIHTILRNTVSSAIALSTVASAAVTVNSSDFSGVTNGAISTSGKADWGYVSVAGGFFDSNLGGLGLSYDNTDFGNLTNNSGTTLTTVSITPSIGSVTLTEGTTGTDTIGSQNNVPNYTFDGNQAHGSYGNFAPGEGDIWRMVFNDLAPGHYAVTLYMGHSDNGRIFDMDVAGTGLTGFTDPSPQIGTLGSTVAAYGTSGSAFTYNIDFVTDSPSDSLALTFGGVSGGFGGAILSGYTVTAIPEPSASTLIGLAALALFVRRR